MPPVNAFPASGSPLVGTADPAYGVAMDFNGARRSGSADIGAYRFAASGNPGWTVQTDFKGRSILGDLPRRPMNLRVVDSDRRLERILQRVNLGLN